MIRKKMLHCLTSWSLFAGMYQYTPIYQFVLVMLILPIIINFFNYRHSLRFPSIWEVFSGRQKCPIEFWILAHGERIFTSLWLELVVPIPKKSPQSLVFSIEWLDAEKWGDRGTGALPTLCPLSILTLDNKGNQWMSNKLTQKYKKKILHNHPIIFKSGPKWTLSPKDSLLSFVFFES